MKILWHTCIFCFFFTLVGFGQSTEETTHVDVVPHGIFVQTDSPPCKDKLGAGPGNFSICFPNVIRLPNDAVIDSVLGFATEKGADNWQPCTLTRCDIGWAAITPSTSVSPLIEVNGIYALNRLNDPGKVAVEVMFKNWHASRDIQTKIVVKWHHKLPV